jgi:hypothetical protein
MIRYALVCDQLHEFESWFSNSAAYDKQVRQRLIACPLCGSAKVEKALMTPRLARPDSSSRRDGRKESPGQEAPAQAASRAGDPAPVAMTTPQEQELRRKLRELRDHLVKNSENVASAQDAEALHEEGIAFSALPVLPDDRN